LKEERDAAVEGYQQQVKYAGELMTKLVSAQQELDMYKASSEVFYERLKKACEDREKLIDALQTIRTDTECPYTSAFAKRKLKEIGVTVEWQKSANDMRTTR